MEIRQSSIDEVERVAEVLNLADMLDDTEISDEIHELLDARRNTSQDERLQYLFQIIAESSHFSLDAVKRYYGLA